jgi:hypothetical protein
MYLNTFQFFRMSFSTFVSLHSLPVHKSHNFRTAFWSHREIGVLLRCQDIFQSSEPPKSFAKAIRKTQKQVKTKSKETSRDEFKETLRKILFSDYAKAKRPTKLFDTLKTSFPEAEWKEMKETTRSMCRDQRLKNALDSLDEMSTKSDFCRNDSTLTWLQERFFKTKEGQVNVRELTEKFQEKRGAKCIDISGGESKQCTPKTLVLMDANIQRNIERQIRLHARSVDVCIAIKRLEFRNCVGDALVQQVSIDMGSYAACETRVSEMLKDKALFRTNALELLKKVEEGASPDTLRPLLDLPKQQILNEQRKKLLEKYAELKLTYEEIEYAMRDTFTNTQMDTSSMSKLIRFEIAQEEIEICLQSSSVALRISESDTVSEYIRAHTEPDPWSLTESDFNALDGHAEALLQNLTLDTRVEMSQERIDTLRALLESKDEMRRLLDMHNQNARELSREYSSIIDKRAHAVLSLGNVMRRRQTSVDPGSLTKIVAIVLQPFAGLFADERDVSDEAFDAAIEAAKDGAVEEMRFAIAGLSGIMLPPDQRRYEHTSALLRKRRLSDRADVDQTYELALDEQKKRTPWEPSSKWSTKAAARLQTIFLAIQAAGAVSNVASLYLRAQEMANHYAAEQVKGQLLQKAFERDVVRPVQKRRSNKLANDVRKAFEKSRKAFEKNQKAFERDVVRRMQEIKSDELANDVRKAFEKSRKAFEKNQKAFERDVVRRMQEIKSDELAKDDRKSFEKSRKAFEKSRKAFEKSRKAFERDVVRPVENAISNELAHSAKTRLENKVRVRMGFGRDVIQAVDAKKQTVYIPIVACADLTWFGVPFDQASLVDGKRDSTFLAHGGQCAFPSPPNEGEGYADTVLQSFWKGRQLTDTLSNMVSFFKQNHRYGYDYFFKVFIKPQTEASGMTFREWSSMNQFQKKTFVDRAMDFMPQMDRITARETSDGVELYLNGRHAGYYNGEYDPMSSRPFGADGFQSEQVEGLEGWRAGPRIQGGGIKFR